ncbi:MAG TPA: cytochrome P450 [Acidimicrobiia bacterium]|jgi:cytochrome P450|nr:cytochrome P450 [Acidimicrobiia bacterium]
MPTTAVELSGLELFEACSDEDLAAVTKAMTGVRRVREGEVICAEDEVADRWWIVLEGQADATWRGLYLGTILAGETIGELALLDGKPRTATVTATTDVVLQELDGEGFVAALLQAPRVAVALLRQFATRLRATDKLPALPAIRPRPPAPPRPVAARGSSATHPRAFDPGADGYFEDPYAHLAPLREQAAVHWSEAINSWVVTRYQDVHRLSRDRSLLGSVGTQDPVATLSGQASEVHRRRRLDKTMTRRDGEDHLRLRRLVSKVFTPRAVSSWKDRTDRVVEQLLGEAADKGKIDVMGEFALPLPAQIISEMLGMPQGDHGQLRDWSHTITRGLDPSLTPEEDEAATAAGRGMFDYVAQVVADKRQHPGDDILTALIQAEEAGDRLETEEIQAQVMILYVAGHETTANLIGNGLTNLFRFPEQLDLLRADSGLDANAVEEVLRYDPPAQFTRRVNREPLEVGDITIPEGSLLTLALGSANRDPLKWGPTADVLDVARPGANEHVSFGGGSHFCLGNALARLETQAALPKLVRRFPRMEPAYSEPAWMHRITLRGVETLPIVLR